MTHGVHAGQREGDRRRIAHVRAVSTSFGSFGSFASFASSGPHVEHERFVPALRERLDDMGPDEPGTAGDQNTHTATLDPYPHRTGRPHRHVTTP